MKKILSLKCRTATLMSLLLALSATLAYAQNPATTLEERHLPRYDEQTQRMEQGEVDLLWVGDSITDFWDTTGKEVWDQYYGNRKAMNFGIGGDRTGHVLWRLENSPVEKISPKMTIVMIGTNNVWHKKPNSEETHSTPAETVEGIEAVVNCLKAKFPKTKILLLEVFPSGATADDPHRLAVNEVNKGLEAIYANSAVENVQLFSINNLFLNKDGSIPKELMPDFVHPSVEGYKLWAKAVEPMIADGLEENTKDTTPTAIDPEWWSNHSAKRNEAFKKGDVDILMIGDSITRRWEADGAQVWEKYFGEKSSLRAINLGDSGEQTQHVLWRLDRYDFSNANPKAAVLLIGVNNTWSNDRAPKDVALGQRRIVKKLRALFPNMKIFVMKIFPCTMVQDRIDPINELTPYYIADIPNVEFVDINKVFLNEDGVLTKDVMPDLLHPNALGYESWAAAMYLKLKAVVEAP